MSDRTTTHATFTIERIYDAPPSRVFAAFADPALKARWFGGADTPLQLDFRIGGEEVNRGGPSGGPIYTYRATYHDIVPGERIVTAYTMDMDDTRISVSVATFELHPEGDGTRLTLTEQGAFLDGLDDNASREHGTAGLLDALGRELEHATAGA